MKERGSQQSLFATRYSLFAIPFALGVAVLAAWEFLVRHYGVPAIVLPPPSAIWAAFAGNFASLMASLWVTFSVTLVAMAAAFAGGLLLAVIFSQSRLVEAALYPYAVVLQVTPVIAVTPLILIWVGFDRIDLVLVIIAWMIAFFPVLANTTLGLKSADHNLIDLFRLYGASRWQILTRLQMPTALPYLLGAMRVSGGLALIGVVTAEMVAGSGAATGLGWRIIEAGNRLEIAKMFAALALLSILGIAIFFALSLLEWATLHRWHESAVKKQG